MTDKNEAVEEMLALEGERLRAMLEGDVPRLRDIFSPRLCYVHSSGEGDTRDEYLHGLETGHFRYNQLISSDQSVMLFDDVAIIDGKLYLDAIVGGAPRKADCRTTSIWAKEDGQWRHLRFHSTSIPRASA